MQPRRTATYLLRFDDLCPTLNWKVWAEIESALVEHHLKPMVAVVPDNQDPKLRVDAAEEGFWDRVRGWQARGWTIGLHGFQHKYVARHAGIGTGKKSTEFAGLGAEEQARKLRGGTQILEREGLHARVWIAPNNSFDATTVRLLPSLGIDTICDGCFRFPFRSREGMFWVPQQLFGFRPAPAGVWTVCYHHNDWTDAGIGRFRDDLDRYGPQVSSLEEVAQEWAGCSSRWSAFLCARRRLAPLLIRCQLKLWQLRKPRIDPKPNAAKGVSAYPAG